MFRYSPWLAAVLLSLPAYATDLPAQISSDTTLTAAQSPYLLPASTLIDAGVTVTVEPGVEIIATGDVRLFVYGTLSGGSAAGPAIVLRSSDAGARGAWQGVYVAPTGHLRLTHATLTNGVYGVMSPGGEVALSGCRLDLIGADGLYLWGGTALSLENCEVRDCAGRGLYVEGYQATGTVANCHFADNGSYPVQLKAPLAGMLGAGNSFSNDGIERIGVSCSLADDITGTTVWGPQPVPLELGAGGGDATLTIAAGGRLTIAGGNTLYATRVECRGRLDLAGAAGQPVTLTAPPATAAPGAWEGLILRPGSTGVLSHVALAYAATGLTADGASVTLSDAEVEHCQYDGARLTGAGPMTIRGVTFRNNGRCGVRLEGADLTGTVQDCQFLAGGSYPIWSVAAALRCVQGGHVYVGNALERIGVSCGGTPDLPSGVHVWTAQSLPLDCSVAGSDSVLSVGSGASLTLPAGQTLYLGGLDVSGWLEVAASAAYPCLFLPAGGGATPGAWNGLRFAGGGGALRGAVVRYGATGLALTNASPTVHESSFCDSQYDGLSCGSGAAPVVTRSAFVSNGRHGVYVTGTGQPNLGDVTNPVLTDQGENQLYGNGGFEVYNETAGQVRAQNNTWVSTDEAAIAARVYDHEDDPSRGSVIFRPLQEITPGGGPRLDWTHETGFTADGTDPNTAAPGATIRFRAKYTDPAGKQPSGVRLHLLAGATPVAGSPFLTTRRSAATYDTGAIFGTELTLPAGRDYRYWFAAARDGIPATGPATVPHSGPVVNTVPTLTYSTAAGYDGDGVAPDTGPVGTVFVFRCVYADGDGDEPTTILLHLWCSGVPVDGSPFDLTAVAATSCAEGRAYELARVLGAAGSYSYKFQASDGVNTATGAATGLRGGPTVSAVGPLVSGLVAQQVRADLVEVRWRQAATGTVTIDIRNLAGRTVARVCRNLSTEAGDAVVWWPRTLSNGTAAPAGSYVLVLAASAGDGTRWQAMAPLPLR